MGKADRRNSNKMKQRRSQAKKKARLLAKRGGNKTAATKAKKA